MKIERETDEQYRYRRITEMYESDQRILTALKRVDRARESLIKAQNNLAIFVTGADDYTRDTFVKFYAAGGVTAEDWQADLDTSKYQRGDRISRGQLRLVQGDRRTDGPAMVQKERHGGDHPGDAA